MTEPDVSLLIVSFNTRDRLRQCLASLPPALGSVHAEIIVVDNASRDGSADMLAQEFPHIKLIRGESNLGFANANNLAAREALGRYWVLLNPDAVLPEGAIEQSVTRMDAETDIAMAGGRLLGEDGSDQPSARLFPSLMIEFLTLSGLAARYPHSRFFGQFDRTWADPGVESQVDWVPGAFAILRRETLDQVGFFDPRFFLYYEEVDLCRRIHAAGWKIMYWPALRIMHIGGESSKTLSDMSFSSKGSQLTLWRMRSQLLYYRKWHGLPTAWAVKTLEQSWHRLRGLRNRGRSPEKAHESRTIVELWTRAWKDTDGGAHSPPQPW